MSDLTVEIRGLRIFANHGVYEFERRDGQEFVVDVTLVPMSDAACTTDNLDDAVNYGEVARRVVELVQGGPHQLIERVAGEVADDLLQHFAAERVTVRVAKPQAPLKMPFDHVAVTVTRSR